MKSAKTVSRTKIGENFMSENEAIKDIITSLCRDVFLMQLFIFDRELQGEFCEWVNEMNMKCQMFEDNKDE